SKWSRRHRTLVGAVAVGLVLACAGLLVAVVLVWHAMGLKDQALQTATAKETEARKQRERADANFRKALQGVNQLLWQLENPRWAQDSGVKKLAAEQIATGIHFFREFITDNTTDPALRYESARAYCLLASVYGVRRDVPQVFNCMERARDLFGGLADEY